MSRDLSTALIHHAYTPPAGFQAPQGPVHKASTVVFKDVAAMRARDWKRRDSYTYGLHGTPTTFALEERIATLEGGTQCLLVPSGLAAVTLVDMALLAAGDEVLLPSNVYGPSREFARHELARWGIGHRLYDPMDTAALAAAIGPQTRQWAEATTQARGVEAVRALVGLKHLAGKHQSEALEEACRVALTHGAYHLRAVRQLLKRQGVEQRQFEFLEEHPIIRPLSDYSLESLLQFRKERHRECEIK